MGGAQAAGRAPTTGTVALLGPPGRFLVALDAGAPDGATTPVRALVDTGGGAMVIRRQLVERLDLAVGATVGAGDDDFETVEPPRLWADGYELDTDGLTAYVVDDEDPGNPLRAERADLLVPAPLLRRHHLVLDAPAGQVTFAALGTVEPRGLRVPVGVHPGTGFVRTEITVDGRTAGVLLDTGPSCSLVVDATFRAWQGRHPTWPVSAASVGPANMAGLPAEARTPMVRAEAVEWGPFTLTGVAFAWRADAAFADLVAPGATGSVIGALAGNVLRGFRVEVDYGRAEVWLEQGALLDVDDTDMVGVVLTREVDAEGLAGTAYRVAATVTGLGDVRVGDRLVAVDGEPVAARTLAEVVTALGGELGATRPLTLERDGELVQVDAPVTRVL
jgi:hypothetical protein